MIVLYDPQQHSSYASLYVQDPGVISRGYVALALWYLGYPDQALKRVHEALTLARELSHPCSLCMVLAWGVASLHQYRREEQAAQEGAEAGIALSSDQGSPLLLAMGTILRGWALAEQGQGEEGIAQMRQGLAAYRATGAGVRRPYYLALLAKAYGKVGQTEEGLGLLAEALALVDKNGERYYEAELYRLKGELTLQEANQKSKVKTQKSKVLNPKSQILDPRSEAEACFQKAIAVACRQSAKSLELRAAMSLSRLWQQQGKQYEAHKMLSTIYNWFTEGFDTVDLQEAQALLEELRD